MKRTVLIVLVLVLSCKKSVQADKTISVQKTHSQFQLAKSDYTILTYHPKWHWTFKSDVKSSELNQSELIEIEEILKSAVQKHNQVQKNQLIEYNKNNPDDQITKTDYEVELNGYLRQYVPVLNSKGQKEVYINFFCSALDDEDWQTELVQVEDGGNCYYNLKINLVTKRYYEFEVNYSL